VIRRRQPEKQWENGGFDAKGHQKEHRHRRHETGLA
jgi:hypothetical protein